MKTVEYVREELFKLQDLKYREFHKKLIPTVDENLIIGVRTPELRKFAKEFSKDKRSEEYLKSLPHKYYEENNLHGHIIEGIKEYEKLIEYLDEFLPNIDNWATCDLISPKIFKKYPNETYEKILTWLKSDKTYTVRFGIVTLMGNYLDKEFKEEHIREIISIKSEEYYINMAIAWYMSFALIKQYETAVKYIEEKKMEKFVHNKSIQKAVESRRIPFNRKEYLKTLKIK